MELKIKSFKIFEISGEYYLRRYVRCAALNYDVGPLTIPLEKNEELDRVLNELVVKSQ